MVTAFGLGMLAVLALPPLHIVPALFLAIPGLIAMIGGAASWTGAFWLGLAWGFGFFTGGLYWITSAILTDVASLLVAGADCGAGAGAAAWVICRGTGGDCLGRVALAGHGHWFLLVVLLALNCCAAKS